MKSVLNKSNLSSSPLDEQSEHHAESERPIHEKVIMEEDEGGHKNKDSGSKLLSVSAKGSNVDDKKEKEKSLSSKKPSQILSGDKLKTGERMKSAKNLLAADEPKPFDMVSKKEDKKLDIDQQKVSINEDIDALSPL